MRKEWEGELRRRFEEDREKVRAMREKRGAGAFMVGPRASSAVVGERFLGGLLT